MESHYLPAIEREVFPIGMGTWQLGGKTHFGGKYTGYGPISEKEAIEIVRYAVDHGINFFDTADTYGRGRSEKLLGKALQEKKHEVVICSKFGNREDSRGHHFLDFSKEWLKESVEGILQRLDRDYLDILLMHSPPDDFDWENYDPTPFEQLKKEGKIRSYGVSSKTIYGAERVAQHKFGQSLESIYNLADRRAEERVFPLLQKENIYIARMPFASGFLTGKYLNGDPRFPEHDIRASWPQGQIDWLQRAAEKLRFLQEETGGLPGSAVRFCVSHPDVSVVIPGFRTIDQLKDIISVKDEGPLSDDLHQQIEEVLPDVYEGWKK